MYFEVEKISCCIQSYEQYFQFSYLFYCLVRLFSAACGWCLDSLVQVGSFWFQSYCLTASLGSFPYLPHEKNSHGNNHCSDQESYLESKIALILAFETFLYQCSRIFYVDTCSAWIMGLSILEFRCAIYCDFWFRIFRTLFLDYFRVLFVFPHSSSLKVAPSEA